MIVEVHDVGMILVDGFIDAIHELGSVGRGCRYVAGGVLIAVEIHGIHALPPLPLSVQNRLERVVGNARLGPGRVAGVAHRHPLPPSSSRRVVKPDAETHALLARDGSPRANHVHLHADPYGIPGLVGRIPAVEVVMV